MATAANKTVLDKLRLQISEFLKLSPNYDDADGFNLQRWLNFYHGNLSVIVPKLENHLVNRKVLNLDDPDLPRKWSRDEYACAREHRPYEPLMEIDGAYDRDGNLVHFGRIDPQIGPQVFRHTPTRANLTYNLIALENRLRNIRRREQETGKMTSCTTVYDMDGCSMKTFVEMAYNLPPLVKECEANYPGTIAKVIIINAPASVHAIFRVLSAVLPKSSTLDIVGKASPEPLLKLISSENLPVCYHGTRTDIARTYEESTALPLHPANEKKDDLGLSLPKTEMSTVRIPAHGKMQVALEIETARQTIRWWFNAKNGPVEFAIYKGGALGLRDLVVPKFMSNTHYVAETGEHLLDEAGVYTVVFWNSSNYLAPVFLDYKLDAS